MFEFIAMSLLGMAFINAFHEERKQEAKAKEEKRIHELKMKVFYYAIRHSLPYEKVVESLQKKELSFDDLDK